MTVGETLTASSLGSASGVPVASKESSSQAKVAGGVPTGVPGAGQASEVAIQPHMGHMVTSKIGQELVTSLHLIKDIRRLEKYQRDFFLKVKTKNLVKLCLHFPVISNFPTFKKIRQNIQSQKNNNKNLLFEGERVFESCSSTFGSPTDGHGLVGQLDRLRRELVESFQSYADSIRIQQCGTNGGIVRDFAA